MPTQLKFQQFLNMIVIGVLFELLTIIFLNNFPGLIGKLPFNQFQFLHKDNASLTIILGVIFSFPSWRIVSSFVGYIMEPIKKNEIKSYERPYLFLRRYYSFLFFGIKELDVEEPVKLLRNLCKEQASYLDKRYKQEIETFFSVDLQTISNNSADTSQFFEMISGYIYRSKNTYDPYQTDRLYTNRNFHARMAVLSNFAFIASLIALVTSFFSKLTLHSSLAYGGCSILFFLLCHFWAKMLENSSVSYRAVLTDFLTSVTIEKNSKTS